MLISIPDRDETKIDDSHTRMTFTMEGTGEAQTWQRTFPDPMPATHRLAYSWGTDAHGRQVLTVEPKLADAADDGGPGVDPAQVAGLDKLKVADLQARAAELGIEYDGKWTKAQLVAAIVEKTAK